MRDYSQISPLIWTGRTGKLLRGDPESQVLILYLLTSPHSNSIGLYYLPFAYILIDTGLSEKGALKALRRLSEVSFMGYDRDSEVVFVYEMAKWQNGGPLKCDDNKVKGIQKLYDSIHQNPFLSEFFERYSEFFHLKNRRGSEGAPKILLSTETDRETDRETESETEKDSKKISSQKSKTDFELPDDIPIEPWNAWMDFRKSVRAKDNAYAKGLLVKRLREISVETRISIRELIDLAIEKQWQSLKTEWVEKAIGNKREPEIDMDNDLVKKTLFGKTPEEREKFLDGLREDIRKDPSKFAHILKK